MKLDKTPQKSQKMTIDERVKVEDNFSEEFQFENVKSMVISGDLDLNEQKTENDFHKDQILETLQEDSVMESQLKNPLVCILINSKQPSIDMMESKNANEIIKDIEQIDLKQLIKEFVNEITTKSNDLVTEYLKNSNDSNFSLFIENKTNSKYMSAVTNALEASIKSTKQSDKITLSTLNSFLNKKTLQSMVKETPNTLKKLSHIIGILKLAKIPKSNNLSSTLTHCCRGKAPESGFKQILHKFLKFHYKKFYEGGNKECKF